MDFSAAASASLMACSAWAALSRLGDDDAGNSVGLAVELGDVTGQDQQLADLVGRLSANAEPVLGTLRVDADDRRVRLRIVVTDLFDDAAVTLLARIDNDNTVLGSVDLTPRASGEFELPLEWSLHFRLVWTFASQGGKHRGRIGPGHDGTQ